MTATVTTWLDGRTQTVPADDPRLAAIQTARHIANLHRISPAREGRVFRRVREGAGSRGTDRAAGCVCGGLGGEKEGMKHKPAGG